MYAARIVFYEVLTTLACLGLGTLLVKHGASILTLVFVGVVWIVATQSLDIFRRFPPNDPKKRQEGRKK